MTEGTGLPFATFAVHVAVGVLQYCAEEQSESTAQPQVPVAVHVADRQTVVAVAGVHEPSPAPNPHFASVSQTPERQTATPEFPGVQVPSPFAKPHFASVSQTPERQTATPEAAGVHVPSPFK